MERPLSAVSGENDDGGGKQGAQSIWGVQIRGSRLVWMQFGEENEEEEKNNRTQLLELAWDGRNNVGPWVYMHSAFLEMLGKCRLNWWIDLEKRRSSGSRMVLGRERKFLFYYLSNGPNNKVFRGSKGKLNFYENEDYVSA